MALRLMRLLSFVLTTSAAEGLLFHDPLVTWGDQALLSVNAEKRRYLDLTYGSPSYPDCVCGLPSPQNQGRSPRQLLEDLMTELATGGSRVVGGVETVPHSLPWMALILDVRQGAAGTALCGGAVISDRYVISAAHCFNNGIPPQENIKVVLGEHDRCLVDRQTTQFSVERLLLHPAYRHTDYFADLALLRLSMRLTFSRTVRPICLPTVGTSFEGTWSLVAGWGSTQNDTKGRAASCPLRQAALPVIPKAQCLKESKYPPESLHETLLCAGIIGQGKQDACQGDSGGPLQIIHPGTRRITIIGIVSNGIGCGLPDYPGLYTTVAPFVPWILAATRDSAYCFR